MARDLYLKPNGTLYPCSGKLWFVPLEDKALWTETETKVSLNNELLTPR
jgi:hypothetical protein